MLRVSSGFQTLEDNKRISFLVFEAPIKHSRSFLKYYLTHFQAVNVAVLRCIHRTETLKKVFSNVKNGFKKHLPAIFFVFGLLISNHTVSLVQFEINMHL